MLQIEIDLVIPYVGITLLDSNTRINFASSITLKIILTLSPDATKNDVQTLHDESSLGELVEFVPSNISPDKPISSTPVDLQNELASCQNTDLLRLARPCIESGRLELSPTGVGGTYIVLDENTTPIAIFKPVDEEPGAPNNPKGIIESPLLPYGGGAKREVAAFLLGSKLANVPETHLLDVVCADSKGGSHKKFGSVQRYINNEGDATMFGASRFFLDDVQSIGLLDLRLLNLDRNGENILVQKDGDNFKLVPIDHAYILPNKIESIWFEWMTWRQAKLPFQQRALDYIDSIDIEQDSRLLMSLGIEEQSIKLMRKSSLLIQLAAKVGFTLYDIAALVCRKKPSEQSEFEILLEKTNPSCNDEEEFVHCAKELVKTKKNK